MQKAQGSDQQIKKQNAEKGLWEKIEKAAGNASERVNMLWPKGNIKNGLSLMACCKYKDGQGTALLMSR